MRLFIDVLPESSFAKSLSRRGNEGRGKAGFDRDPLDAFRTKAYHLAQQTERLRSRGEIERIKDEIEVRYKKLQQEKSEDVQSAKLVADALRHAANFALNPPRDAPAATANRIAFMMTIGFNASSAFVNMSQLP